MKKINDIWENYKKIGLIVSNTFLNIYKAKNKLTKEYVIIKEIKKIKINFSEKEILKEIEIMEKIRIRKFNFINRSKRFILYYY